VRIAFADAFYWIALIDSADPYHEAALAVGDAQPGLTLVTTEDVLSEVLDFMAGRGQYNRAAATEIVMDILCDARITTVPQTHESFAAAFSLYRARPDKTYSLTDCLSMTVMRERGITDVLTHDRHFAQEGFTTLL
jgi:uncharacterized protein